MNTALTRTHKISVILLCLLAHLGMFVMLVVPPSSHDYLSSPTIIIEADPIPQNNAVSLAAQPQQLSSPPTHSATPQAPATPPPPTPATTQPSVSPSSLVSMDSGIGSQAPKEKIQQPTPALETPKPEPVKTAQHEPDTEKNVSDEKSFDEITHATQFFAMEKSPQSSGTDEVKKQIAAMATDPAQVLAEKKRITLAQITNRVLEQMEHDASSYDEQNDAGASGFGAAMQVRSNRRGPVSMQQIVFVNYCKKILACVVNSYRIHKPNAPRSELTHVACIKLALTNDGKISSLTLLQSSGNPAIDHFLLSLFHDACSSFPPVPSTLTCPLEMPIFNISALEQLQSADYWFIQ